MKAGRRIEGDGEQGDAGVLWVVWALGWIQELQNQLLYWRLARSRPSASSRWRATIATTNRQPPGVYYNYFYVLLWLAVAVACCIGLGYAGPDTGVATFLVAVVLLRVAEIVVGQTKMLLDKTHRLILAPERNLVFLIVDSGVAVTATATLLRNTKPHTSFASSWVDALGVFTLNGRQPQYPGGWGEAATLVGTFAGLALGTAALAVLLGLISEKFKGGPEGQYTGPRRINLPRRTPPS